MLPVSPCLAPVRLCQSEQKFTSKASNFSSNLLFVRWEERDQAMMVSTVRRSTATRLQVMAATVVEDRDELRATEEPGMGRWKWGETIICDWENGQWKKAKFCFGYSVLLFKQKDTAVYNHLPRFSKSTCSWQGGLEPILFLTTQKNVPTWSFCSSSSTKGCG